MDRFSMYVLQKIGCGSQNGLPQFFICRNSIPGEDFLSQEGKNETK